MGELTEVEWQILETLYDAPGGRGDEEALAAKTGLSPDALHVALKKLETLGLVRRAKS